MSKARIDLSKTVTSLNPHKPYSKVINTTSQKPRVSKVLDMALDTGDDVQKSK
jgi:tRNA A37 methylthiotransferase MiaB